MSILEESKQIPELRRNTLRLTHLIVMAIAAIAIIVKSMLIY